MADENENENAGKNHPEKSLRFAGRRSVLKLNSARNRPSRRLPWALIPYHRVRARRVLEMRFNADVEWALTAIALAPNLPFPIDPFLRQTFGEAFQKEPDPVLLWLRAIRDEDERIKSTHPVRHYLLWHAGNIFDDADPVLEDPFRTLRRMSEDYAVAPPDSATLERETTLIRNTLLHV